MTEIAIISCTIQSITVHMHWKAVTGEDIMHGYIYRESMALILSYHADMMPGGKGKGDHAVIIDFYYLIIIDITLNSREFITNRM